jgi:transcriptional regulator with XRE-family HTH domain
VSADTPGWLGLLRIYRHEKGSAPGRPYPMRQLARDTGLSYSLLREILDGKVTPTSSMLAKLTEALDIPDSDAEIMRQDLAPPNEFAPIFDVRSDAQILADAINNLADAIREAGGRP